MQDDGDKVKHQLVQPGIKPFSRYRHEQRGRGLPQV